MPYPYDLTTLATLKDFISPGFTPPGGTPITSSDGALSLILSAVSNGIARYLSRQLEFGAYSEIRNGQGRSSIRTLRYPILSVTNVQIRPTFGAAAQTVLPASALQAGGITNDNWFINMQPGWFGSFFPNGKQNVTLNYLAGFVTPGMVAVQALPQWPGNLATVKQGQQIQVNGYYFTCRVPGVTQATGMPAFPGAAGGVAPTLPGYVWGEEPAGLKNSVNRIFTFLNIPNPAAATQLYFNGIRLTQGSDYTLVAGTITLTFAPASTDVLVGDYPTAGIGAVLPSVGGSVTNTVVIDGSAIWVCKGFVPVIPAGVPWLPEDIELACLQQCSLLFKNRTRVGDTSTGVGADRVNYFLKDAHPSTIMMLNPHRETFPTDGMGVQ